MVYYLIEDYVMVVIGYMTEIQRALYTSVKFIEFEVTGR